MIKHQKAFAVIISIAVLAIFSIRLDYFLAGSIPQSGILTGAARFFSMVGNGAFLFGICAVVFMAGSMLNRAELKDSGKLGALSILLSGAVVHIFKASFERPRIEHSVDAINHFLSSPALFDLTGRFNSFPSGHTTTSFALAYVLARRHPSMGVFFYAVAALVAASRVYLGSHYPTDILAGAFIGVSAGYLIIDKTRQREKWIIAGLGLLIVSMSFFKTGGFLLFDVDEAVFSEAAREMVETGDYITPTYNYEPRYDKPILIYWFMSLAFKFFGTTEFAARFTSSMFGTMLVMMTFLFIRRVKGLKPAALAALALLLNLEFFVYTHSAVTDMTLAFFIAASLFSLYMGAHEDNPKWYAGFWAAAALATLTKGVVGLLFPAAITLIYLFARKDLGRMKAILKPSYIGLFLLISAPWFALQFMINGWDFFNAFIVKHHIQRYSGVISSHGGPFYYYIGVLLVGFFPWVSMLPNGIYKGLKERLAPESSLYLLCSVWFLFVLVFFSIARTKLPNYIFPLFAPAAILAGLAISDIIEKRSGRQGLYIMLVLSGIFASALLVLPSIDLQADLNFPPRFFYALAAAYAAIGVFSFMALSRTLPAVIGASGIMVMIIIFLRLYALPPVNIYLQKTLYDYSVYARENLGANGVLATYEINKPSIAFYSRRKVLKADKSESCNLREYVKRGGIAVITTPSRVEELREYDLKILDSRGDYVLLGTEGMPPVDTGRR